MNRWIITISILVIVLGISSFLLQYERSGVMLRIKENSEILYEEIEMMDQIHQSALKYVHNEHIDSGYLPVPETNLLKKYEDPMEMVRFMFTTAFLEDIHLFSQSFAPSRFSYDLFEVDNPDKLSVALDMMRAITRGGKLEDVELLSQKRDTRNEEDVLRVRLHYHDNMVSVIDLHLVYQSSNHDHVGNMVLIKDSVWEIIDNIEDNLTSIKS